MAITRAPKKKESETAFIERAPDGTSDSSKPTEAAGIKVNKLQISLTIAPDILAKVDMAAKKCGMTRAGVMNLYIFEGLDAHSKKFQY